MAKPSRPGIPQPKAIIRNDQSQLITGKNVSWQFAGSTDSTDMSGYAGVGRYIGDIIESQQLYANCADRANTKSPIAPNASKIDLLCSSYGFNKNTRAETLVSADATFPATYNNISDTDGILIKSDLYSFADNISASVFFTPIFGNSARLSVETRLLINNIMVYGILSFDNDGSDATFQLKQNNNTITTSSVATNLTIPQVALINGGTIEIYCSVNNESNLAIVEQYYTPSGSVGTGENYTEQSFLLGSYILPFSDAEIGNLSEASVAFYLESYDVGVLYVAPTTNCTIEIEEFIVSNGKLTLNADLGDCKLDDLSNAVFPVLVTPTPKTNSFVYWNEALKYQQSVAAAAYSATNTIRWAGGLHELSDNEIVTFGGDAPVQISLGADYYVNVVDENEFQIKNTIGGAIIELSSAQGSFTYTRTFKSLNTKQWANFNLNSGSYSISDYNSPTIDLSAKRLVSTPDKISVCELHSVTSSLSERFNFTWEMEHTNGDFYVAISPESAVNLPLVTKCLNQFIGTTWLNSNSTLAIIFDKERGNVNLICNGGTERVFKKQLCKYNVAAGKHIYSIDFATHQKQTANGTWINVKIDNEIVGTTTLLDYMTPAQNGLGYYVAMGVKSIISTEYDTSIDTNTNEWALSTHPAQHEFTENDNVRITTNGTYPNYSGGTVSPDVPYYISMTPNSDLFRIKTSSVGSALDMTTTGDNLKISRYCNGEATVYNCSLRVAPISATNDAPNMRHFSALTSCSSALKPLLGQYLLSGNINNENYYRINQNTAESSVLYLYQINISDLEVLRNEFFVNPRLIELKIRSESLVSPPNYPKISLYSDCLDTPYLSLSDWITCDADTISNTIQKSTGKITSYNNLLQFDVSAVNYIKTHNKIWLLIDLPHNCTLATTEGSLNDTTMAINNVSRGVNLITNSDFETDTNGNPPVGWITTGDITVSQTNSINGKSLVSNLLPRQYFAYDFTTGAIAVDEKITINFDYKKESSQGSLSVYIVNLGTSEEIHPNETITLLNSATQSYDLRLTFNSVPENTNCQLVILNDSISSVTTLDPSSLDYSKDGTPWVEIDLVALYDSGETSNMVFDNFFLGTEKSELISSPTSINNLWFKCYADYSQRSDNLYNNALTQLRVMAQSYDLAISNPNTISDASTLSEEMYIDIESPSYNNSAPILELDPETTVNRTSLVKITAEDSSSGILAFKIGHTVDNNQTRYTEWLPWNEFTGTVPTQIEYTLHHFGNKQPLDTIPCNLHTFGAKTITAQVMDNVGNIVETNPVTTLVLPTATVDYNPPQITMELIDPAVDEIGILQINNEVKLTKNRNLFVKLSNPLDKTDIKDMRFKDNNSVWSVWKPYNALVPFDISKSEGLHRVEVQIRDFGNNITPYSDFWDIIGNISNKNIVFNNAVKMNNNIYLSGIKTKTYTNFQFINANDNSYDITEKAYKLNHIITGITFRPKNIDRTSDIIINAVTYSRYYSGNKSGNYYYVEQQKGHIVFGGTLPTSNNITVSSFTVKRETAVIYKSDTVKTVKIADFNFYNERAITAMISTSINGTEYLIMGGYSGNIYGLKNDLVEPLYTTIPYDSVVGKNLPVSFLIVHQFLHESEAYIYAGTAQKPKLYRAPLTSCSSGSNWVQVAESITNGSGDLTCATSAYNWLFIGTNNGIIYRYERDSVDAEQIYRSMLKSDANELLSISCLNVTGNEVAAGIKDRPEIWNFSMQLQDAPSIPEKYVTIALDIYFMHNPAPWSYYSDGETNTRTVNSDLKSYTITDKDSPNGWKDVLLVAADSGKITTFTAANNSEWQKAINDESWTFEIDMLLTDTTTGRQGFQIADGRYLIDVHLDANYIYVKSGINFLKKSLVNNQTNASVFTVDFPYSITEPTPSYGQFPDKSIVKLWNFSSGIQSDAGPFFPNESAGSNDWSKSTDVASVINYSETDAASKIDNDGSAGQTSTHYGLKIVPSGVNPRILCDDPYLLDTQSKIMIRAKYIKPLADQNCLDAKIRLIIDNDADVNLDICTYVELPLQQTEEYCIYEFAPALHGNVAITAIDFINLSPTVDNNSAIYIDYIAVVSDAMQSNITQQLTPIRVGVDDKDVKIWVGKNELPIVDSNDFLATSTTKKYIKFGKLYNSKSDYDPSEIVSNEPASNWAYSKIKFASNIIEPPVSREIHDFHLKSLLPNTGGISTMFMCRGTIWAASTGINSPITFNQCAKIYKFNPMTECWEELISRLPIKNNVGVGKVFAAVILSSSINIIGQHIITI